MLTVIRFSSTSEVILPNSQSHHALETDLEARQAVKPLRWFRSKEKTDVLDGEEPHKTHWKMKDGALPNNWIGLIFYQCMLTAAEVQ